MAAKKRTSRRSSRKSRSSRGRRRHGDIRGVYSVAGGGLRLQSFGTKMKAIEHAKYLENRGYTPYVYEFIEEKPESHRRIVYGPGLGKVAPPYRG